MSKSSVATYKEKLLKSNLTDRYIFQHSVKPIHIVKPLVEGLLREDIGEVKFVHDEMTQSVSIISKDTRYDILVEDSAGTLYDVEMENRGLNIFERIDYYQAMLAISSVNKGNDYSKLAMRKVIVITNFDPYDDGLFIYNIVPICKQRPNKSSNMKFEVILLNLKGKHGWEELTPEIQDFVKLARDTTAETASQLDTEFGRDLFEQVTLVKNSVKEEEPKMGYELDLMDARNEGIVVGMDTGMNNTLKVIELYKENESVNKISEVTGMSEENIDKIIKTLNK